LRLGKSWERLGKLGRAGKGWEELGKAGKGWIGLEGLGVEIEIYHGPLLRS
jgi:hypothetical protein